MGPDVGHFAGCFYVCVLILGDAWSHLNITLSLPWSTLRCISLFIICSLSLGPVFGNMDKFVGLGVFVDTYPNEEKQHEVMASVRA